jgi:tetratricopeptide (TPR) repeat protein
MILSYSHGREFVEQVRPFLEKQDAEGLVRFLRRYWPHSDLRELLTCGHDDATKVAAVCLSVIGTIEDNAVLAPLLHDDDPTIVSLIEHAMWSVWFRASDRVAHCGLQRAVRLISASQFDAAIQCLDRLIEQHPCFAEAYNQRAIAYFLKESYAASLADCTRTLRLNPFHFGAMAGVGHCHASLGRLDLALEAYSRALKMHPRMEGIRQSIQQIRSKLGVSPMRSAPEVTSSGSA